jgi:hypothetical protein
VSRYKAHIQSLDTEVQELAKQPMLNHGLGLQVLHEELQYLTKACGSRSTPMYVTLSSPWEN